jgi:uncharacterized protein
MSRFSLGVAIFLVAMATCLSGCRFTSPPVTFYTLSPIPGPPMDTVVENGPSMIIGVQPVTLPGTIDRIQMVTRSGPNRLEVSSLNRWADYPEQLVQQAIAENLQVLMPDTRVVNAPWPPGLKPDVLLTIDFSELIGTSDGQMLLGAGWTLTGEPASSVRSQRINLTEPISGRGYDELAAAHSRILATFCRKVTESVKAFRDSGAAHQ